MHSIIKQFILHKDTINSIRSSNHTQFEKHDHLIVCYYNFSRQDDPLIVSQVLCDSFIRVKNGSTRLFLSFKIGFHSISTQESLRPSYSEMPNNYTRRGSLSVVGGIWCLTIFMDFVRHRLIASHHICKVRKAYAQWIRWPVQKSTSF